MRRSAAVLTALAAALALAACGGGGSDSSSSGSAASVATAGGGASGGGGTVKVSADPSGAFKFNTKSLTAKSGGPSTFALTRQKLAPLQRARPASVRECMKGAYALDEVADPVSGMRFPHAARLELDELLEQLVARARDVQALEHLIEQWSVASGSRDIERVEQSIRNEVALVERNRAEGSEAVRLTAGENPAARQKKPPVSLFDFRRPSEEAAFSRCREV